MRDILITALTARFANYAELIGQMNAADLQQTLDIEKHKSIAEHLWCIVGARESYAKALKVGEWQGFECSMSGFSQADFHVALNASAEAVVSAIDSIEQWTESRDELLATLAEHEVMHEGQIIRHLYAVGGEPAVFKWA